MARQDHADVDYRIYSYPRFADVYFSPDEKDLVIDDHNGSGTTGCVVLSRIDKPPYYVKARNIDGICWKLFWSLRPKLKKLLYDHSKTYFCEWLDSAHFVVGLQGDHLFPDPGSQKWSLEAGWHCVYDAASGNASTSRYTDAKNKEDFSIEK